MSLGYKEKIDVDNRLVTIAYNNLSYATIGSILVAMILCIGLWTEGKHTLLGLWFVLISLTNTFRYIDMLSYRKMPSRLDAEQWKQRFYLGLVSNTLLWAAFILVFFPSGDILLQAFILIMVAGLSSGAANSLSSYPQFFITFFVLFLVPLSMTLYQQGGTHYILLSITILIYMVLMIAMASKFNRNILELIHTSNLYYESERNLKRSQDQVMSIFQQAPIGIFSFDKELCIVECNQGMANIMHSDIETLKGHNLQRLQNNILYNGFIERIFKGEDINYEGQYKIAVSRQKKVELWIDVRATPTYNDEGEISGGLVILTDITDKKLKEEQINFLAFHDELTHLPNRSLLHDRLEQLIIHIERHKDYAAVMFIDLDHFKTINDSLGHHIGDIVLQEFSLRISKIIRKEDTFSRLGGDEFILLLSKLSTNQTEAINTALKIAAKIHDEMQAVYAVQKHNLHITASIGVTLVDQDQTNKNDILKHADLAMYKAKEEGRNRTCFYESAMDDTVKKRLQVENDLHDAIDNDELKLYYQPIIRSGSSQIVCAEALLRYIKSDGTIVYPDDFIPIAEESGLIIPIGYWVIEEVCKQFIQWKNTKNSMHMKNIAINISPKQFMQPDFISKLVEIIEPYGIDFSTFELELTESVVICDIEQAIVKMNALKELGFILSMDDFGTGYSSLSYLKNLPFDIIKIDKSFIQNILVNDDDKILVNTILEICKKFNRKVIAEGIETEEHMEYLNSSSCDYYQGYAISRPVTAVNFQNLIGHSLEESTVHSA